MNGSPALIRNIMTLDMARLKKLCRMRNPERRWAKPLLRNTAHRSTIFRKQVQKAEVHFLQPF
jgi:hypothetical protein